MKDLAEIIGIRSREVRNKLGFTQSEVAEFIGISPEVYGRLERGKMSPSIKTLVKLAKVLNVTANDLIYETVKTSLACNERKKDETQRLIKIIENTNPEIIRKIISLLKTINSMNNKQL